MNKDNKYSSIKTSLNEATRTQLINKSKSSPKGKQRFNRKNKSKVANSVREFNAIDMNKLFKEGILTVGINVTGETDNYVVKISFGGFLDLLNKEITRANNKLDLRSIIRALQKGFNQENVYIHCSCPDFCLHGDTKIKLLSGEVDTIRNIIERFRAGEDLWVYSTDKHGDFKPGHILDAWISGYENELIEITLDNGNKVVTTKNHLYMLRNGEYERADNLVVGQSLMPMYFSYHNGYENVKMNSIHIIEIKTISYDDPVPVYDITVDKYNNFLVDAGVVVHNCYRFNYWATFNKYDSGPEQHSNGKWIRNPTDNLGAACKHTLLVLSNNFWLIKVASVINNYIKYAEKNMKKAYADIIYPAIYKKKFEEPTQLSIFDTDNLDDSQETVDTANELGRTSGRFQQGNPYRFQSGNKPPKNQISIDEIETDEEN